MYFILLLYVYNCKTSKIRYVSLLQSNKINSTAESCRMKNVPTTNEQQNRYNTVQLTTVPTVTIVIWCLQSTHLYYSKMYIFALVCAIYLHTYISLILTYFAPQRFTDEYRVDREHQPVVVVTTGVTR